MSTLSRPMRFGVVATTTLTLCAALVLARPIPQDQAYHLFADTRALLGIGNFADVASNGAFLFIGIAGLWATARAHRVHALPDTFAATAFALFFAFVIAVSAGSAYYHLQPDDNRLLWDRLPIALAFMSLFALVITDRLALGAGSRGPVLAGLLVAAVFSLVYWQATGDLRLYIGIQFIPIVVLPLLCLTFPHGTHIDNRTIWMMLGFYIAAKLAELFDRDIYALTGGAFGGHALKHLLAAAAVALVVRQLARLGSRMVPVRAR